MTEDKARARFDYLTATFVDSNGNKVDKDKPKTEKFNKYIFGRAYLTLVSKNALNQDESKSFAEDLIKKDFNWMSLSQLKNNITRFLKAMASEGVHIENALSFKSTLLKKEASKKNKEKTGYTDLIAELESFKGVKVSKKRIDKAQRSTPSTADKIANRKAFNTTELELMLDKPGSHWKSNKEWDSFAEQFKGDFEHGTSEEAYNTFVKHRGPAGALKHRADFWGWLQEWHKKSL